MSATCFPSLTTNSMALANPASLCVFNWYVFFLLASTNPLTNSANSRVNKPNLSLTVVLRCFLILFSPSWAFLRWIFFVDEETQLKWTTNYKINKLSFKVAWEKASDVVTADWLNLSTWNVPVNHNMPRGSIFPPFVCAKSQRSRLPAFLYFLVGASDPKVLQVPEGFFPCCLRRKLSGEAAIVMITALSLNFCRKQQEKTLWHLE